MILGLFRHQLGIIWASFRDHLDIKLASSLETEGGLKGRSLREAEPPSVTIWLLPVWGLVLGSFAYFFLLCEIEAHGMQANNCRDRGI